jgi:predicted nucleotidyltransferase
MQSLTNSQFAPFVKEVEQDYDIQVLFITGHGPAVWGYSKEDPNLHFIYKKPLSDYLNIGTPDILSLQHRALNKTFKGTDIRTLFKQLVTWDLPTLELLSSSSTYWDTSLEGKSLWDTVKGLASYMCQKGPALEAFYTKARGMYHSLRGSGMFKKPEKIVEPIRYILCCQWLNLKGSLPPASLASLNESLLRSYKTAFEYKAIETLIKHCLAGDVQVKEPYGSGLIAFLHDHLSEYQSFNFGDYKKTLVKENQQLVNPFLCQIIQTPKLPVLSTYLKYPFENAGTEG